MWSSKPRLERERDPRANEQWIFRLCFDPDGPFTESCGKVYFEHWECDVPASVRVFIIRLPTGGEFRIESQKPPR